MWRAIALFFLLACSQFLVVGAGANASAASAAIYDYGVPVHAYDGARHTVGVRNSEAALVAPRNVFPTPQENVATAKGPLSVASRLLLPQTPRRGAEHMAMRALDAIELLDIPHEASTTSRHVTVSIGVSCYDEESACWSVPSTDSRYSEDALSGTFPVDLVQAADKAMYSAKHCGRGQARLLDVADVDEVRLIRDIVAAPPITRRSRLDEPRMQPGSREAQFTR